MVINLAKNLFPTPPQVVIIFTTPLTKTMMIFASTLLIPRIPNMTLIYVFIFLFLPLPTTMLLYFKILSSFPLTVAMSRFFCENRLLQEHDFIPVGYSNSTL